ncbi:unnamed protein product [Kuraishia capsulata CBS 1993]|uniref:Uncharacterized protein n=1 Tax=Kuraishia capsulata CBS 1993 TaxID=1382522 RepID=W6MK69_9ASCO|nr:uncharacterized protein KUCA_T00002916001 [Kuraishia capsulata CBS 1993]CDK26939.1 unnamed protein product [Kuraishia capsulata CBS 1993]
MSQNGVTRDYRVVVVGPPVVGKSALTIRLTQSEFATDYDPTIEDSYKHYCEIDGVSSSLDILDTAGQEEYSSMRDLYMSSGEGFVLVFSLTDRKTFEEITGFYNQIVRVKGESSSFVPLMLVGNKSDLQSEREVSSSEGIALAKRFGAAYIESSAKTNVNVSDAFYGLVKIISAGSLLSANLTNVLEPSEEDIANAAKASANAKVSKKASTSAPAAATEQQTSTTRPGVSQKTATTTPAAPKESGGCCVIV